MTIELIKLETTYRYNTSIGFRYFRYMRFIQIIPVYHHKYFIDTLIIHILQYGRYDIMTYDIVNERYHLMKFQQSKAVVCIFLAYSPGTKPRIEKHELYLINIFSHYIPYEFITHIYCSLVNRIRSKKTKVSTVRSSLIYLFVAYN